MAISKVPANAKRLNKLVGKKFEFSEENPELTGHVEGVDTFTFTQSDGEEKTGRNLILRSDTDQELYSIPESYMLGPFFDQAQPGQHVMILFEGLQPNKNPKFAPMKILAVYSLD